MLTIHHLNNARSQRILWLLEELGLEYQIKKYQRDPKTMLAPLELRKVHPLGKSPVLTDGDETLAESGAIVEYLLDRYANGRLRPQNGTKERLRYNFFLHYAEGSAMPPLLMSLIFSKIKGPPMPLVLRPFAAAIEMGVRRTFLGPQLKLHFDFLESQLVERAWFAGPEFSACDIQMSFPIEAGSARVGYTDRPHLRKFLERIHSRPAYRKALEVGGEYDLGM